MRRPTCKQAAAWCKRYEEQLGAHNVRVIGRLFPTHTDLKYRLALSPGDKHSAAFTFSNGAFETPESSDEYADRALAALRSDLQQR